MSQVKTITELFDYLPHRYPFLLLDRVTEIVKGEYIRGYKNITFNEEMFSGHFPGQPIMPGVLILEAMAQISGCAGVRNHGLATRGWSQLFIRRRGQSAFSQARGAWR